MNDQIKDIIDANCLRDQRVRVKVIDLLRAVRGALPPGTKYSRVALVAELVAGGYRVGMDSDSVAWACGLTLAGGQPWTVDAAGRLVRA
jgi:hypothetical protein